MSVKERFNCSRQEGQVLVLFALMSFVLVGCLALAFDIGYLLTERRAAQNAADAAALAGAVAVLKGEDTASAKADAVAYALDNGIACAACVNAQATGDRKNGKVTVDITVPVSKFFLGAVYTGDWEVTARAVAEVHDDRVADYGLVTFQPPGTKFNGNNSIIIHNGSAMTNDAVNANPSNAHEFVVDGTIDSAGPIHNPNSKWKAPNGMNANMVPIDDPIASAGIVPPNPNDYDVYDSAPCEAGCTWPAGVYRNGSALIKNGTVTLEPGGVYYFENFSISFQNTNSRLQGNNVMLYFDEKSEFFPKNGEVYLTAPATSPYPGGKDGMVFWFANCDYTIESQGNADYYLEGIVYAPCTDFVFRGTPDTPVNRGQMLVGSVEMKGTGRIEIDYSHWVDIRVFEVFLVE